MRVDIEFKDAEGKPQKKTTVKVKGTETEEQVLYSNHEDVIGEVRSHGTAHAPGSREPATPPCAHAPMPMREPRSGLPCLHAHACRSS